MKLFKSTDEKLSEIGFEKTCESDVVVQYKRYSKTFSFYQIVDIVRKSNGRHLLQSYDAELMDNNHTGNVGCGLTGYEMKLFLKKMKQLGLYSKAEVKEWTR